MTATLAKSRFSPLLLGAALLGLAFQVSAQTQVDDAWVRATVAGQQATGAFMTLTASTDSKLIEVQSPAAKLVQVHQMSMHNDVMSMKEVKSVDLPAGKPVSLDPHGYHVMLMDLVAQVKEGDKVPLTLIIENAKGEKESVQVEAPVRALNMADHKM